jgi:DNA repair photolyase
MYSTADATSQVPALIGVEADRALERPHRPCLQGWASVNVAAGCSFGCLFCPLHLRGRAGAEIQLRANLPALLESELAARRRAGKLPRAVVFSNSTDLFQPIGPLLAVVHESMRIVLAEGLHVFFQARGLVPEGFGGLFAEHGGRVHAQLSLFCMDEALSKLYEPGAPGPRERLETLRRLVGWGVDARARIEPLIPFISDTAGHLEDLVRHLRSVGVSTGVASYLVLQPHTLDKLQAALPAAHFHVIKGSFRGQVWRKDTVLQMTRLLPEPTRAQGYARLRAIAQHAGMDLRICGCQDPTQGSSCFPGIKAAEDSAGEKPGQLDLFGTG